jgi:hypothetical protein
MSFYQKYLKYKNKYLDLKNQFGGQIKNTLFKGLSQAVVSAPKLNNQVPKLNYPVPSVPLYNLKPINPIQPSIKFPNLVIVPRDIKFQVSTPSLPSSYPTKKYFIVYGTFNNSIVPLIEKVKNSFDIKPDHLHKIFKKTILEPHTSIVYEPEFLINSVYEFEEYKRVIANINSIDKLYPGITNYLDRLDKIDDVILEGASAFFRENIVIIKIGFNSKKMNKLRNFLYNSSASMKHHEELWRQKVSNPKIKEMYSKSRYYKDDETFSLVEPKLWIHTTIAALDPKTTSIEEIDHYLDLIQEQIKADVGKVFSMDKIKLRDPEINNTIIWDEKKGELRRKYLKQIGGAWASGVDFGKLCNDSATTNKFPRDLDLNGWEKNTYSVETADLLTFKNSELDRIEDHLDFDVIRYVFEEGSSKPILFVMAGISFKSFCGSAEVLVKNVQKIRGKFKGVYMVNMNSLKNYQDDACKNYRNVESQKLGKNPKGDIFRTKLSEEEYLTIYDSEIRLNTEMGRIINRLITDHLNLENVHLLGKCAGGGIAIELVVLGSYPGLYLAVPGTPYNIQPLKALSSEKFSKIRFIFGWNRDDTYEFNFTPESRLEKDVYDQEMKLLQKELGVGDNYFSFMFDPPGDGIGKGHEINPELFDKIIN